MSHGVVRGKQEGQGKARQGRKWKEHSGDLKLTRASVSVSVSVCVYVCVYEGWGYGEEDDLLS